MRRVRRRKDALLLKPVGKGASIPLNAIPKRNPKPRNKPRLGTKNQAEQRLRMKVVRQLSQMINELLAEDYCEKCARQPKH